MIQSILFARTYWTEKRALNYLKRHNYRPIKKVHKTKKYLRYRLKQPNSSRRYITISLTKTIKAVVYS